MHECSVFCSPDATNKIKYNMILSRNLLHSFPDVLLDIIRDIKLNVMYFMASKGYSRFLAFNIKSRDRDSLFGSLTQLRSELESLSLL